MDENKPLTFWQILYKYFTGQKFIEQKEIKERPETSSSLYFLFFWGAVGGYSYFFFKVWNNNYEKLLLVIVYFFTIYAFGIILDWLYWGIGKVSGNFKYLIYFYYANFIVFYMVMAKLLYDEIKNSTDLAAIIQNDQDRVVGGRKRRRRI